MNDKIDKLLTKLTDSVDTLIDELQTNPIRTAVKVLIILWAVKQARRLLKG